MGLGLGYNGAMGPEPPKQGAWHYIISGAGSKSGRAKAGGLKGPLSSLGELEIGGHRPLKMLYIKTAVKIKSISQLKLNLAFI